MSRRLPYHRPPLSSKRKLAWDYSRSQKVLAALRAHLAEPTHWWLVLIDRVHMTEQDLHEEVGIPWRDLVPLLDNLERRGEIFRRLSGDWSVSGQRPVLTVQLIEERI